MTSDGLNRPMGDGARAVTAPLARARAGWSRVTDASGTAVPRSLGAAGGVEGDRNRVELARDAGDEAASGQNAARARHALRALPQNAPQAALHWPPPLSGYARSEHVRSGEFPDRRGQ
jgi:hypothetical protein